MNTLSVYVHIPFCLQKCPYCDFNSHAIQPKEQPIQWQRGRALNLAFEHDYLIALEKDLQFEIKTALARDKYFLNREVVSVFFGGGTPSLFSSEAIASVINTIKSQLNCRADMEVTLEANPSSVEAARFLGYRQAGVNRLSIGVQSFDDQQLKNLGRVHDSAGARAAIAIALQSGFENGVNLDLMFALPQQSQQAALADLKTAIDFAPAHISHYQLTIEAGTAFYYQPPALPSDKHIWQMQKSCQQWLKQHGFEQYEVSAYAQKNRQCQHNLNYWRFGDYLGIGAGAHQKLTFKTGVFRSAKWKNPDKYQRSAGDAKSRETHFQVPESELAFEFMLNALRLKKGVDAALFTQTTGLPISSIGSQLDSLKKQKLLKNHRLAATKRGRRYLNSVLEYFL